MDEVTGKRKAMASDQHAILVVCTGNICRSTMGEWMLRDMVRARGLDLHVASAGTSAEETGNPASRYSVEEARRRGYRVPDHSARQVRDEDFAIFDVMLGMTHRHMDLLERRRPAGVTMLVGHFMEHSPRWPGEDVPDPWGGSRADYAHAADMIEDGAKGLAQWLLRQVSMPVRR